jgi:hypothetical protein
VAGITSEKPERTLRRERNVSSDDQAEVSLRSANLADDQVSGGVTAPLRTVVDCARVLPFAEALAIADSALRVAAPLVVTREPH